MTTSTRAPRLVRAGVAVALGVSLPVAALRAVPAVPTPLADAAGQGTADAAVGGATSAERPASAGDLDAGVSVDVPAIAQVASVDLPQQRAAALQAAAAPTVVPADPGTLQAAAAAILPAPRPAAEQQAVDTAPGGGTQAGTQGDTAGGTPATAPRVRQHRHRPPPPPPPATGAQQAGGSGGDGTTGGTTATGGTTDGGATDGTTTSGTGTTTTTAGGTTGGQPTGTTAGDPAGGTASGTHHSGSHHSGSHHRHHTSTGALSADAQQASAPQLSLAPATPAHPVADPSSSGGSATTLSRSGSAHHAVATGSAIASLASWTSDYPGGSSSHGH